MNGFEKKKLKERAALALVVCLALFALSGWVWCRLAWRPALVGLKISCLAGVSLCGVLVLLDENRKG